MNGKSTKGVVAAGHQFTAEAAGDMLRAGGNAIDAAIAALAMSCLCEPVLSSPGGGGFAMVRDGVTGQIRLVDFFPQTPLVKRQDGKAEVGEILADFGTATQAFHIGAATTATPGFFAGIQTLHNAYATMGLGDLFSPVIHAAREGIAITPFQHYLFNVVRPILTASEPARGLFAPEGAMPAIGDLFKNSDLADAFEIMSNGAFTDSEIGNAIVAGQRDSGNLTHRDLSTYEVVARTPFVVQTGGSKIHLNPLPAASGVLIGHALDQLNICDPLAIARALHSTDKARREVGSDLSKLLSTPLRQRGTTHISIIDQAGNACSVTVSNGEGNGELVDGFGFMLNNILGEEDVNPHGTRDWPTNVRLSSMMCPTLIEAADGAIVALGSGGSSRIRSAMLQVMLHHCAEGASLADAVEAPRLHIEGNHLDFEGFFGNRLTGELCKLFPDHRSWSEPNMFFGGVHAARLDAMGNFSGIGDARRAGAVVHVE